MSHYARRMTKNILYTEEPPKGWGLYGKTDSGFLLSSDKTKKLDIKHGWFIGWIKKSNKNIIFVNHIIEDTSKVGYLGPIS